MKRRDILKSVALATGLPSFGNNLFASVAKVDSTIAIPRKRALRVAHLTDVHVMNEKNAPAQLAKCLHKIQSLKDPVQLILNTGDTIFDALGKEKEEVNKQWQLWHAVLKNDCSLPMNYAIGNHDVWGIASAKNEALYGKSWAVDQLKLNKRYYSFDKAGWHFVVLDSTHINPDGSWYTALLDEEQFAWLESDLKQTPANVPVIIMSHIPIISGTAFYDKRTVKNGNWEIPGSWIHTDAVRLVELFYQQKNVKLCLSGHMHLLDRVDYNGTTYLCNGAVSGNWWNGEYHYQTRAGFATINLYTDGTFDHEYLSYQG